jgi:hypothetical protein
MKSSLATSFVQFKIQYEVSAKYLIIPVSEQRHVYED